MSTYEKELYGLSFAVGGLSEAVAEVFAVDWLPPDDEVLLLGKVDVEFPLA